MLWRRLRGRRREGRRRENKEYCRYFLSTYASLYLVMSRYMALGSWKVEIKAKELLKLAEAKIGMSSNKAYVESHDSRLIDTLKRYDRNRQYTNPSINIPTPAIGPYCFNINSQLILTADFLYFRLSSLNLPLISPILSKLSPRYNKSSIFFVITFVTSLSSSFSLSRFCVARESWYVFLVRWIKVSNSRKE